MNAYFVSENDIKISDLKMYLTDKIPKYMVPNFFTRLESLPISKNGKLDIFVGKKFTPIFFSGSITLEKSLFDKLLSPTIFIL